MCTLHSYFSKYALEQTITSETIENMIPNSISSFKDWVNTTP